MDTPIVLSPKNQLIIQLNQSNKSMEIMEVNKQLIILLIHSNKLMEIMEVNK